jgi:hypothetical protein
VKRLLALVVVLFVGVLAAGPCGHASDWGMGCEDLIGGECNDAIEDCLGDCLFELVGWDDCPPYDFECSDYGY